MLVWVPGGGEKCLVFAIETLVLHIYKSVLQPFSFVHSFPHKKHGKGGTKARDIAKFFFSLQEFKAIYGYSYTFWRNAIHISI